MGCRGLARQPGPALAGRPHRRRRHPVPLSSRPRSATRMWGLTEGKHRGYTATTRAPPPCKERRRRRSHWGPSPPLVRRASVRLHSRPPGPVASAPVRASESRTHGSRREPGPAQTHGRGQEAQGDSNFAPGPEFQGYSVNGASKRTRPLTLSPIRLKASKSKPEPHVGNEPTPRPGCGGPSGKRQGLMAPPTSGGPSPLDPVTCSHPGDLDDWLIPGPEPGHGDHDPRSRPPHRAAKPRARDSGGRASLV